MQHVCSKQELWSQEKHPLLGNGCKSTQQYWSHRHAAYAYNSGGTIGSDVFYAVNAKGI
jgi:hypothetical protein